MNTPYQDLMYLKQNGTWPRGVLPEWVRNRSIEAGLWHDVRYVTVAEYAYRDEVRRLTGELNALKGKLENITKCAKS